MSLVAVIFILVLLFVVFIVFAFILLLGSEDTGEQVYTVSVDEEKTIEVKAPDGKRITLKMFNDDDGDRKSDRQLCPDIHDDTPSVETDFNYKLWSKLAHIDTLSVQERSDLLNALQQCGFVRESTDQMTIPGNGRHQSPSQPESNPEDKGAENEGTDGTETKKQGTGFVDFNSPNAFAEEESEGSEDGLDEFKFRHQDESRQFTDKDDYDGTEQDREFEEE